MRNLARAAFQVVVLPGLVVVSACSEDAPTPSNGADAGGSTSSSSSGGSGATDAGPEAATSSAGDCTQAFRASCKLNASQCADLHGMSAEEAKTTCDGIGGTIEAGKCTRTGLSAGCQHVEGATCTTKWYYAPTPANVVQAGCRAPDVFRTP